MSRGDRLFLEGAAVGILLALMFGLLLQPEQPKLAGDSGYHEQAASYRTGGSSCEPAAVRALPPALRQRKADSCAEGQEQHREAANSFIENRRAAIAAEASAIYTAAQARIEAWGAAIGLLTLFAAASAAFFAKKAADHTETNAAAAAGQLIETRKVAAADLRPYLFVDRVELIERRSFPTDETDEDGEPLPGAFSGKVVIYLRNFGKVPARKVMVFFKEYWGRRFEGRFWGYTLHKVRVPICAPGHERRVFGHLYVPAHQREDFDLGMMSRIIRLRFTFEDDFGKPFEEKAAFVLYGSDLNTFYLMTDARVAEMRQRAKDIEPKLWDENGVPDEGEPEEKA